MTSSLAAARLAALRTSVNRLQAIAGPIPDAGLTEPAYPTEWSIADVLSHLGSGAIISVRRVADVLAGQDTPVDFNQGVWDEWNAKAPTAQRTDSLAADAALLATLEGLSPEERAAFHFTMGPIEIDFDLSVGLRVNEHALHTWDIEVALDPTATVPTELAEVVADNLGLILQFAPQPTGTTATITVATPDAARGLTFTLVPDATTVTLGVPTSPDVVLDPDALVRLVYGRLDPEHTTVDAPELDLLRRVFPGG